MDDKPYTTADEDPFNVQPYIEEVPVKSITRKRSSMLDKWILEQQAQSPKEEFQMQLPEPKFPLFSTLASSSNPYLAYPGLSRTWQAATQAETDSASINSYDLVDDDDIPSNAGQELPSQEGPSTPIPARTHKSRHSITPSLRTISLTFRNSSPSAPSAANMETASRVLSRLSLFPPRTPRSSTGPSVVAEATATLTAQHARSSSLSTLSCSASQQPTPKSPPPAPSSSSKWRPTVLGHFNQSSTSQISIGTSEANYTPSRPSVSSGDTYATSTASRTTTIFESNIPSTPSKLSLFDSLRLRTSRSPRSASASTFSVASTSSVRLSTSASTQEGSCSKNSVASRRIPFAPLSTNSTLDNVDDEEDLDPPPTYRFNKHEPMASYSSNSTLKRVKFSSLGSRTGRKKKKLIISGIGVAEVRKFEGIKRWCESFGDIRQINRMPNGDLQIDFRDPEVADTVCRVRAKVFIAGVGSVQLSWIAGNKR
ncbi:hypothetical protein BDN70DRAFT_510758 [Pholiota conissans]|uniref:RRM domain-containing protein n=1 Tax=Pholiota conissans TaxID=109636 RepID=A0A9P6CWB2_9AGAR|nr:hypothetical protein BDN70DRAFT_510758 [Pholiota conissans]